MAEPVVTSWLLFPDAQTFTHYLTGAAATDASVLDRPWNVLDLASGDGRLLAVAAGRKKDKLELPRRLAGRIPLVKATVDRDVSVFTVIEGPGAGSRYAVVGKERPYPNAIQAVPLVPWAKEPKDDPEVVFRVPSREKLVKLVSDHIAIENHALSVAGVRNEDGTRAFLLRARRPSRFIIFGLEGTGVSVFYRASNRPIYFPWGWTHPLVRWMTDPGDDAMIFADEGGEWRSFKGGSWRDVGDLLEFSVEPETLSPVESRTRLRVQLKLEGRPTAQQPEMWLLNDVPPKSGRRGDDGLDDDFPRLEQILVRLQDAQEDLRNLEFAYVEVDLPDGEKPRYVVVRERITGTLPKAVREELSLGGTQSYVALRGLQPPLMLPVAQGLTPELKLERYAKAFELRHGEVTILDDAGDGRIVATKIEDRFIPFERFVDVLVNRDVQRVKATLLSATFDLKGFMYDLSVAPAPKKNPGAAKEWVEA